MTLILFVFVFMRSGMIVEQMLVALTSEPEKKYHCGNIVCYRTLDPNHNPSLEYFECVSKNK